MWAWFRKTNSGESLLVAPILPPAGEDCPVFRSTYVKGMARATGALTIADLSVESGCLAGGAALAAGAAGAAPAAALVELEQSLRVVHVR